MGLFTKDKKANRIAPPPVATEARGQIESFIKQQPFGTAPDIPTREIAGTTALQDELRRIAGSQVTGEDFGISADVLRQEAQRDVDVATSPEFEGFRRQIQDLETQQQTGIRQRGEIAGQLVSSPTASLEAENVRKFDTALLQEFARLERQNRQDKVNAASKLTELGTERIGQVAAVNKIVDQERAIEQARNDAIYNQAISTVLFPYQEQLQLFALATGQKDDFTVTGGGLSDIGFLASAAATAAGGTDFSQF